MTRFLAPTAEIALTPRVARLLALSALALVAFFGVYLLAVHTELGQRGDEAALTGVEQVPERAQDAAGRLLRTVSVGSLLIATAVLTGIALLRRRPALLLLPAAIIGISLIATEVFKLWLFERPDLVIDSKLAGNSYPSGHTTVFASIGLAFVVVAPRRLRPWAGLLAIGLAASAGVFTVTADWHRPSDAIGSYSLTLAVTAGLLALLYARVPGVATAEMSGAGASRSTAIARRIEVAGAGAAIVLFIGALTFASLRYGPDLDWNRFQAAYLLSSGAIVAAAALTVGSLLRALRRLPARPR
jgi:hypothetical protein